jgi:hypothetical protein
LFLNFQPFENHDIGRKRAGKTSSQSFWGFALPGSRFAFFAPYLLNRLEMPRGQIVSSKIERFYNSAGNNRRETNLTGNGASRLA